MSAMSSPNIITTAQGEKYDVKSSEAPAVMTPIPIQGPLTELCSKSKPPVPAKLTLQQESMYNDVLNTVSMWTEIPESNHRDAKLAALSDDERMFFSRECILRYLRATKWKTADALKRLKATLVWRREYGADTFTADYISPENETGKQVIMGWDVEGRTCLYLCPGRQNTKMSDRQIQHLSYMLDRTIEMLPPGQETTCLLISFKGAAHGAVPSVSQAKAVLNILQNHNPERLGKALISDVPWYVSTFFKIISPFIDPVTREKMKFHPKLSEYVPSEQLTKDQGGDLDFTYNHATYWPALTLECRKRREAYRKRWIDGGSRIGEFEAYLHGGSHQSLSAMESKENNSLTAATEALRV